MSLSLFTTLALAMPCPCELVGFDDALDFSAHQDGAQHRQLFDEGGVSKRVGLGSAAQPLAADVRSRHLSLKDLPLRESLKVEAGSAYVLREKASERHALDWRTKKAEKLPFPNVPEPLALSENSLPENSLPENSLPENSLLGDVFEASAEDSQDDWQDDWLEADSAELAEGVLLVDAVPAEALGGDDLEIGVEAVIPPPVPIEEIQSDLLEVLGLDSQAPEAPASQPREVPPWAATFYGGRFTSDDLGPALIGDLSGFEDSALVGFGLARTLAGRRPLSLEAEGQILQHFGNQGHSEATVALVLRWHDFPWDDKIDTTFAIGEGLSFATSVPELEIRRNGRSTQLLNYLLFELTFALPQEPDWQFVGRLHHRSGVYGLFDGVGSGSNIYSAGIRRRF